MRVVIDRIEGEMAVLEVAGTTVDWPVSALPAGVGEGSTLSVVFSVVPSDPSEAEARLERLRQGGPKGDVIDL